MAIFNSYVELPEGIWYDQWISMDINGYYWISMIFLSEIWWLPILIFDNKRITVFLPVYTWVPNLMLPPDLLSMTSMIDETEIKPQRPLVPEKEVQNLFEAMLCADVALHTPLHRPYDWIVHPIQQPTKILWTMGVSTCLGIWTLG